MIEIKFKEKDKKSGESRHGGLFDNNWLWGIDRKTISKYIGFKDLNNVELYECDIVIFQHIDEIDFDEDDSDKIDNYDGWQKSVIDEDFCISGDFGDYNRTLAKWAANDDHIIIAIGNIHDNPELMETK